MKLYYSPGSCAMAVHITANEVGLALETEKVDLRAKTTASGADFLSVNPNGFVPCLVTDAGEILTESSVLMQYVADLAPEAGLIPAAGTMARYRVQEMLSFLSTEVHKNFAPFFVPGIPDEAKAGFRARLIARLGYLEGKLANQTFIVGDSFTPADAYLFTLLGWVKAPGIDLAEFPALARFRSAIGQRPAVQKTLQEEGLA